MVTFFFLHQVSFLIQMNVAKKKGCQMNVAIDQKKQIIGFSKKNIRL